MAGYSAAMRLLIRSLLLLLAGLVFFLLAGIVAVWAPDQPVSALAPRWAQAPSQFVPVGTMLVHLRDEGPRDDPAPIVLLHGTSDSLHTWDGWSAALRGQRRVIRFDLPGFGLTGPHPQADYSIDAYVRFVLAVLDTLDVQTFVLGGNSLGGQIAGHVALAALDQRYAVILQQRLDLLGVVVHGPFEQIFEEHVGGTHADRHLEFHRHRVVVQIDGNDVNWFILHRLDPAGERPEDGRHVELPIQHFLHHVPGLILGNEIAVVTLKLELDVVDDAPLGQGPANAGGLEDTDGQILQLGIIKTRQFQSLVVPVNQDVRRLVDRFSREQTIERGGDVEHHVAELFVEDRPCQAAIDQGLPVILDRSAGRVREDFGHLVLEALPLNVGERHVPGIGTDIQSIKLLPLIGGLSGGADRNVLGGGQFLICLIEIAPDGLFVVGMGRHSSDRKRCDGNCRGKFGNSKWHGRSPQLVRRGRAAGLDPTRLTRHGGLFLPGYIKRGARCHKGIGRQLFYTFTRVTRKCGRRSAYRPAGYAAGQRPWSWP